MKLSRRDRMALVVGGVCVLLFVMVQFVLFPLLDGRQRLTRNIRSRKAAIGRMHKMQSRYKLLHVRADTLARQLSKRPENFSLFSFLEQKAAQAGVKESIAYMKPSAVETDGALKQTMVEMKLKGISLKQLVAFLKLVESPKNIVGIRRISIQENSREDQSTLDVIMQVVSLEQVEQEAA